MKVRVISGSAKGKRLKEPSDYSIRPTTDKVKESIFNIIQFDIEGRKALDLFAGTGQLGIECLSRGAKSVTFVDKSREAVSIVKQNLDSCGFTGKIVCGDSIDYLRRGERFDLILIDPPYMTNLMNNALEIINSVDILTEGGIIICESAREKQLAPLISPYYVMKEYNYGKVKLTTIGKESE